MFSILVYGFIVLLIYMSVDIARRTDFSRSRIPVAHIFFSVLIIAVILGGRYDVGTDWPNYKGYYDDIRSNGLTSWGLEPLYLLLNAAVAFFDVSSSYFFLVISMIQFLLVFCYFRHDPKICAYGMLFFVLCLLPSTLNIVRQSLAICIFIYSMKYIDKSFFKYFICIVCAGLFHYSSFILVLVYLLCAKFFKFLERPAAVLVLYLATVLFSHIFIDIILSFVPVDMLGYKYLNNFNNVETQMAVTSGIGIMINNVLHLAIICSVPLLKSYEDKAKHLMVIYRIFAVGILFNNIFGISEFLSRIVLPLVSLKVILLPYIVYRLIHTTSLLKYVSALALIVIYLGLFFIGVKNGAGGISPYVFDWL